ncbi:hypothetical protein GLE_0186 [Lysobacter enzymogenes]|uniref:Uncharacterized protein n=1 Tax=Lysobacter enzymogenes TaxID=69 RepID=A0A0S2DAJ1_LYSEN|nr:hypothetical protein GLE_0186 [Lysobacter enzymogenes]
MRRRPRRRIDGPDLGRRARGIGRGQRRRPVPRSLPPAPGC